MDSQGPDPAGIQGGSPLQQLHLFHRCFTSLLTPSHGPAYAASAELGGGGARVKLLHVLVVYPAGYKPVAIMTAAGS